MVQQMSLIKSILLLSLITFPSLVFSSAYTQESAFSACEEARGGATSSHCEATTVSRPNGPGHYNAGGGTIPANSVMHIRNSDNYANSWFTWGTNADCNTAGWWFNPTTHICSAPVTCTTPQLRDEFTNTCYTPACPAGQSRETVFPYACIVNPDCPAIVPLCASTAYDCNNGDGTQQHITQCSTVCPTGKHLVGNDCVEDKITPTSCPNGYVPKNGGCETAPPIVCPVGTRPGTVNGESVCASSSSVDPTKSRDPEQHNTGTSTGTETTTTEHKDQNGNVTGTSTSTTTTNTKIDLNTTGLASESTAKGILNALTENGNAPQSVTPSNTSNLDSASDTATNQLSITNPASYFITSFVVLPSASCQTVPMHYKSLQYDFDPCVKLQAFRDLLGYFLYIITVIFIYQTATKPAGD